MLRCMKHFKLFQMYKNVNRVLSENTAQGHENRICTIVDHLNSFGQVQLRFINVSVLHGLWCNITT